MASHEKTPILELLQNVLTWQILEQRLHGLADKEKVKINIKFDGRPIWGKGFEFITLGAGSIPIIITLIKVMSTITITKIKLSLCLNHGLFYDKIN